MKKGTLTKIQNRLGKTPCCSECNEFFKVDEEVFSVQNKNPSTKKYMHVDCYKES